MTSHGLLETAAARFQTGAPLREADTDKSNFEARLAAGVEDMDLLRDHSIAFSFRRRCGLVIQPLGAGNELKIAIVQSHGVL